VSNQQEIDVVVSEVGPRDGLQSIAQAMPTEFKICWIEALADAGLSEIEVGSFVSPKLLPQMSDADEVVRAARNIAGLNVLALAPNYKGAERAVAAGVSVVSMPVSASREHSLSNVRMTPEEAVEQVRRVRALCDAQQQRVGLEVGISTAFGCSIQGDVDEDYVMHIANELANAGVDSIGLSDSVGYANPTQVKRMFKRLRADIGEKAGA
jgi:hydroxymethylglutaryl-CoA lyase